MSRRGKSDFKTNFTIFIIVVFGVVILYALATYFTKRDAIKIDGGRVNPFTSDYKSYSVDDLEDLMDSTTPDLESLGSQFKDLQEEMGQ